MDKKVILGLCLFGAAWFTIGLFVGLLKADKARTSASVRPPAVQASAATTTSGAAESEEEEVAAEDPASVEEEAEQENENPASEAAATSASTATSEPTAANVVPDPVINFTGRWNWGMDWGAVELEQQGDTLTGIYTQPAGKVSGTAEGKTARLSWKNIENGNEGLAVAHLQENGTIAGRWCKGKDCDLEKQGIAFKGKRQ